MPGEDINIQVERIQEIASALRMKANHDLADEMELLADELQEIADFLNEEFG